MNHLSRVFVCCCQAALALFFAAVLGGASAAANSPATPPIQSQARVNARLSSGVVKLGSEVTLIATVENAAFADVRPLPAVDGVKLGAWSNPPSRLSSKAIINGRASRSDELTWTATLRPLRKGEFTIPALEFSVDGGVQRTQPLSLTAVEDLKGEELGVFTIRSSSTKVVEGQPFTIEMTFGWDAALGDRINWANLSLAWWGQLSGAIENDPPPPAAGTSMVEIVLNTTDKLRVEQLQRGEARGRAFRMFRMQRSFTPTRAGALEFPSSWLEFSRVEDSGDIFSRRRDRVESYFVKSEPLIIDVVALPEAGRPADFGGAIGNFTVHASAEPRDVDAGESIKLKVEWSGSGNLEFFSAPEPSRSESFNGFRVYGKTETKTFDRRSVTYDLAPKSAEVKEIPPIVLPVFDPLTTRYGVVSSAAIPIKVRALARASGLSDPSFGFVAKSDLLDVDSVLTEERGAPGPGKTSVITAFAALPLLWLALAGIARRRGDPWAPEAKRRRRARQQLARELAGAQSSRAELEALQNFLGARTAERPEAWQGRDIGAWFARQTHQVPPEAVLELERLVHDLEAAAWGGVGRPAVRERALQLAQALERGGL